MATKKTLSRGLAAGAILVGLWAAPAHAALFELTFNGIFNGDGGTSDTISGALLDHVAKMDAEAKLDAALGRQAGGAFGHAVLRFNRATHRVDDTAELDENAVPGALDDSPVMQGDGRIDQVAAQRPEPREGAILVRSREPAVANDVRDQNRRDLPRFRHGAALGRLPE